MRPEKSAIRLLNIKIKPKMTEWEQLSRLRSQRAPLGILTGVCPSGLN